MGSLIIALKVFFKILFDKEAAERVIKDVNTIKEKDTVRSYDPIIPVSKKEIEKKNDAVILLSTLQREARFIDFIKEPLDNFSDAQIGAAARSVHRDCGKTIERFFNIKPLLNFPEGNTIDLPQPVDPEYFSLSGNVSSNAVNGKLQHTGWQITKCELPKWNGAEKNISIISPAEVEIL